MSKTTGTPDKTFAQRLGDGISNHWKKLLLLGALVGAGLLVAFPPALLATAIAVLAATKVFAALGAFAVPAAIATAAVVATGVAWLAGAALVGVGKLCAKPFSNNHGNDGLGVSPKPARRRRPFNQEIPGMDADDSCEFAPPSSSTARMNTTLGSSSDLAKSRVAIRRPADSAEVDALPSLAPSRHPNARPVLPSAQPVYDAGFSSFGHHRSASPEQVDPAATGAGLDDVMQTSAAASSRL